MMKEELAKQVIMAKKKKEEERKKELEYMEQMRLKAEEDK